MSKVNRSIFDESSDEEGDSSFVDHPTNCKSSSKYKFFPSSTLNTSPSLTDMSLSEDEEQPLKKKSKHFITNRESVKSKLSCFSLEHCPSSTNEKIQPLQPQQVNSIEEAVSSVESLKETNLSPITSSALNDNNPISSSQSEQSNDSSSSKDIKEIKSMLQLVLDQNKKLGERVENLEEKCLKQKKKSIDVPNDVRYHIKLAFQEWEKKGKQSWKLDKNLGAFHDENLDLTRYIRTFVSGLNASLDNKDEIINAGIKTYYASKLSLLRKKKRNPNLNRDCAKNQRKLHKIERRKESLKNNITNENISPFSKADIEKCIIPEMMSSEEEEEDENGQRYFMLHKPSFRTKKFDKLMKILDEEYKKNCSKRSKDQMIKRVSGTNVPRNPPLLKFGNDIFIKR